MQHAGLQYGQGATHSHQSPPFAHATDISSNNGGNQTSTLRQFRKRDGLDGLTSVAKNPGDLLAGGGAGGVSAENIARVRPHNHYPAGPNDYYRYHHQHHQQYSEFSSTPAFAKEAISPSAAPTVKYSEIAEPSPQHVDHLTTPSQPPTSKLKEKDYMDMCNIPQMKQQQQQYSYHSDHHPQYLHKPPPESQYYHLSHHPSQYKYTNHQYQAPKYPENDFLAQLQRLRPKMARSIMNDHIREPQTVYPSYHHHQNQRYYPHLQTTASAPAPTYQNAYHSLPQAGYYPGSNSCSYSARAAPPTVSPRVRTYPDLAYAPQKVSPSYSAQYQQPEYAQHYQHRRAAPPQEYYQQQCRSDAAPFEPPDTRSASTSGLRHFLENWAPEEESAAAVPPANTSTTSTTDITNAAFKERNDSEPVYVINSSDLPLENVSLVATENGQYILKNNGGGGESSVVRLKEGEGERTVNLQILDKPSADCVLAEKPSDPAPVQAVPAALSPLSLPESVADEGEGEEEDDEKLVKDMPSLLDPTEDKKQEEEQESTAVTEIESSTAGGEEEESTARRTHQRIFSVDDIMNNIGTTPLTAVQQPRRPSLPLQDDETPSLQHTPETKDEQSVVETVQGGGEGGEEEALQYQNAISVEDDCVILEIGGALVQLNINNVNGTKVLSVVALSDSLVIDVNGNYEAERNSDGLKSTVERETSVEEEEEELVGEEESFEESLMGIGEVDASEVVIGEEELAGENEVSLDLDQLQQICDESAESVPFNVEHESTPNISDGLRMEEEKCEDKQTFDEIPVNLCESVEEEVETIVEDTCQKIEENETSEVIVKEESELEVVNAIEEVVKCEKSELKSKICKENEERRNPERESALKPFSKRNSDVRTKNETENDETVPKPVSSKRNNDSKPSKTEKVEILTKPVSRKNLEKSRNERETVEVKLKTEKVEEPLQKPPSRRISDSKPKSERENLETKIKTEDKPSSKRNADNSAKPKNEEITTSKPPSRKSTESKTKNVRESDETLPKLLSRRSSDTKTKSSDEKLKKREEINDETPSKTSKRRESEVRTKSEKDTVCKKRETEATTRTKNETDEKPAPKPVTTEKRKQECDVTSKPAKMAADGKIYTKAAKKQYETKTKLSKLEETVNKIKSLKEKTKTPLSLSSESVTTTINKKPALLSPPSTPTSQAKAKRVSWSIRDAAELDRASRRLSWEEYNSRKRKRKPSSDDSSAHTKIADNTVTSSNDDVIEQVEISIESAIKEKTSTSSKEEKISSPTTSTTTTGPGPKLTDWEEDDDEDDLNRPRPEKTARIEPPTTLKMTPIIDVNDFRIPPLLHQPDDDMSLQTYKNVVDSKLNSLNINIPKKKVAIKPLISSPSSSSSTSSMEKQLNVSLIERFLNKSSLDCEELEKVRKIIEFKRKLQLGGGSSANKYEVNTNQLKMQIRRMPSEKRKRFRNLYGEEEEEEEEREKQGEEGNEEEEEEEDDDDSSSKSSERSAVDDYSVYQRDSQGVPKLIFKRKFGGFPQPFVKLERSQAAEMLLAKKRKLY